MIEVEHRAEITQEQAISIANRLSNEGTKTRDFYRATAVQVVRDDFRVSEQVFYDMKIRNNAENKLQFTVKKSAEFNPITRLESEVILELKQLPELITNMLYLGYHNWILTLEHRSTFEYKGSVVDIMNHTTIGKYILEVETIANTKSDIAKAERESAIILKDLGAKPLSDMELLRILNSLNLEKKSQYTLTESNKEISRLVDRFYDFCSQNQR